MIDWLRALAGAVLIAAYAWAFTAWAIILWGD